MGVSGEGLFPHYPGAWFSLSRAFCRSRAGSKDASASGRAPYSGGTSVLYRSCGAQGVSGVFFRGYGLPQRFFPRVGTCCGAPGQRKSPPSDLFMALRLRRLPCAAVFSLPKRSAERADGAFFPAGADVRTFSG